MRGGVGGMGGVGIGDAICLWDLNYGPLKLKASVQPMS